MAVPGQADGSMSSVHTEPPQPQNTGVSLPPPPQKKHGEDLSQVFMPPPPKVTPGGQKKPSVTLPNIAKDVFGGGLKKNTSTLSSEDDILDISRAFAKGDDFGTIVTDKKINRPPFSEILKAALFERAHDIKQTLNKLHLLREEDPVVEVAETRKDIITEASKPSKIAPRDDYKVALKKLAQQKPVSTLNEVKPVIKKKPHVPVVVPQFTIKPRVATERRILTEQDATVPIAPVVTEQKVVLPPTESPKPVLPAYAQNTPLEEKVISRPAQTADSADVHYPSTTPTPAAEPFFSSRPIAPTQQTESIPTSTTVTPPSTQLPIIPNEFVHTETPQNTGARVIQLPPVETTPATAQNGGWSYYTEAESASVSDAEVPVTPLTTSASVPAATEPAPLPPVAEATIPDTIPEPVPRYEPVVLPGVESIQISEIPLPVDEVIPDTTEATLENTEPIPTPEVQPAIALPEPQPLSTYSEKTQGPRAATQTPAPLPQATRIDPVQLKRFALGAIVTVLVGGIIALYLILSGPSETTPTITRTVPSFVAADTQIPFPLPSDRDSFFGTVKEVGADGLGITQVYPTIVSEEQIPVPAKSSEILPLLKLRLGDTFTRSIRDDMMFGYVGNETRSPFIVLQVPAFDVAFAGMLAWEPYLAADLAPLFGDTTGTAFTDAIQNNKSIRVLYSKDGEEELLYGFVNHNLIIITSSSEALSAIISRL